MPLDYDRLRNWQFPEIEQTLTPRDSILYALGIGLGGDPLDRGQLSYLYEGEGFRAFPTLATVLAYPGFWLKDPATGVDWVRVVHGEQSLAIHRPLPTAGRLVGRMRIAGIVDKGAERGALLLVERRIYEAGSEEPLCTLRQTTVCRGDGGFGDRGDLAPTPHRLPEGPPEAVCDLPTLPQAALLYRLSGDDNPLHADPAVARAAGYDRPILHGMATYGLAAHAILRLYCDYEGDRLAELDVRFSAPVFPGETVRVETWRDGDVVSYRASVPARGALVLNNGRARLR